VKALPTDRSLPASTDEELKGEIYELNYIKSNPNLVPLFKSQKDRLLLSKRLLNN
jgi:hypothetical protein